MKYRILILFLTLVELSIFIGKITVYVNKIIHHAYVKYLLYVFLQESFEIYW